VGVCTYFTDKVHQRILKRQFHIDVQRQTYFTALKYIPPGNNPQNVWDAAGLIVSSGHDWRDINVPLVLRTVL
jgi:hypothetical protein